MEKADFIHFSAKILQFSDTLLGKFTEKVIKAYFVLPTSFIKNSYFSMSFGVEALPFH